ncbi:MAG: UDP-3-O-[3-hydroxymyristoyl] glucosamine N-acyltransferase, partial [Candidatus Hydrogenedentes bacterium]|nr:UDP-3-O-[3-hydroxymyristoyl] glucosamine N-acyltransferase [Candidatus Hydrogenedentota bacterium]
MNIPVSEIAELVGGTVIGDAAAIVTGVNAIQQAGPGDLSFVRDARYRAFLETTAAAAVFVPRGIEGGNVTLIQVSSPDVAFAQVLQRIEAEQTRHPKGIHPSAVVGEGVVLGKDVALGAHVVLADACEIGDG